jgi:signal transduction histidine kinase
MALAHLELVAQATRRLEAMTGELLDLTRLQRGRPLDLVYQPADLVALVAAEVALHATTVPGHCLTFVPSEPVLTAEVDAPRLARVVANLLTNATKYSPGGGPITVRLGREAADARAWAVLTVQDAGIGIPASDLPRLFEPFYRAGNVTGQIAGTGLGLAGARQIADAHGGSLQVASTEGVGTTVTLRLPLD